MGIILFIALIIRLILMPYTFGNIATDGIWYTDAASIILRLNFTELFANFPTIVAHFLYPFFIALYIPFCKNVELAGLLVSVTFGTLLIIPAYLLAKQLYGKKVGYISCLLISMYPSLVEYSIYVLTESTYMFFLATSILFGWFAIQKAKKFIYFITGITFALAYLVRTDCFLYIFVLAFIICVFEFSQKKTMVKHIIFLFSGFIIILLPYLVLVHSYTKSFSPFGSHLGSALTLVSEIQSIDEHIKYETIFYGLNKENTSLRGRKDNIFIKNRYRGGLLEYMQSNPLKVIKTYGTNFYCYYKKLLPHIFPPLLILLIGVGLFSTTWDRMRLKKEIYLTLMIAYPFFIYPFFASGHRRLVTILPILIIWMSKGIYELQEWVTLSLEKSTLLNFNPFIKKICRNYIIMPVVILSLLPMTIQYTVVDTHYGFHPYEKAGKWIQSHLPLDSILMSRFHRISFYSARKNIPLPYAEYKQIIEFARYQNVNYIIIDEQIVTKVRPQLSFLLDESNVPGELEVVYKLDNVPGYKLIIYKLNMPEN